jgi:sugar-specific transcriptional regulator TrmB
MDQNILEKLIKSGVSEKSGKIYLTSLELGESTVQEIAKHAGLNRATTYFVIENLIKQGLMSSFHKGKKQYFVAADPDRLVHILEQEKSDLSERERNIKDLVPQIQSMKGKQKQLPVVRYYEGKEGIKSMVDEILKTTEGTVNMAYSVDALNKLFSEDEKSKWRKIRINKKLYTRAIYTYRDGVLGNIAQSDSRKVPLDKFPITCDVAVYSDKVRIASMTDRLIGIVIEDKEIAKTMKAIMDLAWEAAEKYQK